MSRAEASPTGPDLRIVSHGATASEVAAVTAVLQVAVEELAGSMVIDEGRAVSAWARGQRALRAPLAPGRGAWRSFSG